MSNVLKCQISWNVKFHEMLMLMLDLWPQAETPGATHFGAYRRHPEGCFLAPKELLLWWCPRTGPATFWDFKHLCYYIYCHFNWQWQQHIVIDLCWLEMTDMTDMTDIWLMLMLISADIMMLILMLMLWPLAVIHFGAYHCPPDGNFWYLSTISL